MSAWPAESIVFAAAVAGILVGALIGFVIAWALLDDGDL